MNRVVFDSVDAAPTKLNDDENQSEETKGQPTDSDQLDEAATKQSTVAASQNEIENTGTGEQSASDCDNDTYLTPYYQPSFKNDHTLVFESRFESGNLRRAI